MKKRIFTLALVLLTVLSVCSCGSADERETKTINVYNWGEYIDEDTLEIFEEQTGIKVNYTTYANNEEMYAKIVSGAASYDVIVPSDYMISKMISEGRLAKLNFDNIPNYEYIGENYKGLDYDPENEYSVPYTWGTVVIVYNTEYVDEEDVEEGTVDLLWNDKYAGKILMFDNPRDAFALALTRLGYSMNSQEPEEWEAAAEELIAQKPLVQAYVMDQVFDKLIGEEAWIAPYYAGDAVSMMEENEDLDAFVPQGANMFFDSMCIPITCTGKQKEYAEAFINFMCDTEIAAQNANEVWYAIPQVESFKLLDPEMQEDTMIYPPPEDLVDCEVFVNLPDDILQMQSDLWIKLKTSYNKR